MADELQSLLNRIQQDGVAKAEAEAKKIIDSAKVEAARITSQAQAQADTLRRQAENDAAQYLERSTRSLQNAARDIVLSVREAVTQMLESVAAQRVTEALTPETLQLMLAEVVRHYFAKPGNECALELLVPDATRQKLVDYFMQEFHSAMEHGLTIHSSSGVISGFKVALAQGHVQHDFTVEAITESLGRLLRPALAEVVQRSLKS